jgi:hypothetical protein
MSEPILFGLFVATFFVWLGFIRLAPVVGVLLPLVLRRDIENLPL